MVLRARFVAIVGTMSRYDMIHEQLTYSVIGAFFEVYTILGYGFLEHVYMNALARELLWRGHRVAREVCVTVTYKGVEVGSSGSTWSSMTFLLSRASQRSSCRSAPRDNYTIITCVQRTWTSLSSFTSDRNRSSFASTPYIIPVGRSERDEAIPSIPSSPSSVFPWIRCWR